MNGVKMRLLLLVVAAFSGLTSLMAQIKSNDPAVTQAVEAFRKLDQWDIQTFRMPVGYMFVKFGNNLDGDPAKHTSSILSAVEAQVGHLPEGTMFQADVSSGTLVARSTHEGLQRIGYFCNHACKQLPKVITFKLEVFESSIAVDEPLLISLSTRQDQTFFAEVLRDKAAKGEARLLAQTTVEGKSGSRLTVTESQARTEPTLKFEADLTLEYDDIISMNMHFEFRDAIAADKSGQVVQPRPEAIVTTSVSARVGAARVIGMWRPWGQDRDVTRVAVLETNVTPVLPDIDELFEKRARQLLGVKTSKSSELGIPEGMELRAMHCHVNLPELWTPDDAGNRTDRGSADPFQSPSTPQSVSKEPAFQIRPVEEGIKQQGIHFPPGSRAYLHRATSTLVVVNTSENLDQIQALTEMFCGVRPTLLVHELLVVEGEWSLVQSLAAETSGRTDHSFAWTRMLALLAKGELKRTGFIRSETRSGQRLLLFAGQSGDAMPRIDLRGVSPAARDDDADEEEDTVSRIGTRLEVDPVIGPDGHMIDLNLSFTQHQRQVEGAPSAGALLTSTSMRTGAPRLLYLWKTSERVPIGEGRMQAAFLRVSQFSVNP
ncbi:MAG TPA: hypothetical protein VK956_03405 [Verrucomicrobium sp.]|nr:hypothetical protein [Verrucomicrobium sp.]